MMKKKEKRHACRQKQTLRVAVVEEVVVLADLVAPVNVV
jgi:hypothetical protein